MSRFSVLTALVVAGCCMAGGQRPSPPAPSAPAAPELLGPAPPPAASEPQPPVGSPGFCPGDDLTGVPLATSTFRSTLPLEVAHRELDARNEICGDTWCEGSFEWYAYDLRSDAGRSELTLRTYSYQTEPVADVSAIVVSGARWTGRVLAQHVVPSCTSPCRGFAEAPRWAPCLALDLRCEIAIPTPASPATDPMIWESLAIECGIALEQAIRQRVPEQFADD